MSNEDEIKEDTGSDGQSSSLLDSNMISDSVIDNSAGPSQSTSEEQSRPDENNSGHDEQVDPNIIEISDEESNGPSNAALPPVSRKRRIGGDMTVYRVRFNLIGLDSTAAGQARNRIRTNNDDTGIAEQSSSTSRVPDSNIIRDPLIDNSAGPSQSTPEEQSRPDENNSGHDEQVDPNIIEISDEESNGPSNAALPPVSRRRRIGGEMTIYRVRFNFIGLNSTAAGQTATTKNKNNDENRADTERAGPSSAPCLPDPNVIPESNSNTTINNNNDENREDIERAGPSSAHRLPEPNVICESDPNIPELKDQSNNTQCRVIRKPLPNNINNSGQNQRSDAIIEISDDESNASSGPSSRAPLNAPLNAPRLFERKSNTDDEITMYSYTIRLNLGRENAYLFTDQNTFRFRNSNEPCDDETEQTPPRHFRTQNVISQAMIDKLINSCSRLNQLNNNSTRDPHNSDGPTLDMNVIEISDDEPSPGPSSMAPTNQAVGKGNSSYERKFKQEKEDSDQDDDD